MENGAHTVMHWTKTQDRVAKSSGEAELKSACKGVTELIGLCTTMAFLTKDPVQLEFCIDANATVGMLKREGAGALKHLQVRTLWVQEAATDWNIRIRKVPRAINAADSLCSIPRVATFWPTMERMSLTAGNPQGER